MNSEHPDDAADSLQPAAAASPVSAHGPFLGPLIDFEGALHRAAAAEHPAEQAALAVAAGVRLCGELLGMAEGSVAELAAAPQLRDGPLAHVITHWQDNLKRLMHVRNRAIEIVSAIQPAIGPKQAANAAAALTAAP